MMPNLTVSIPHQLTRVEAKRRIELLISQFQQQYGALGKVSKRWEGDTMHFTISAAGMSTAGQVFVEDQAVRLDIPLPWPLAMLGRSLKQQIEQEGHKLLSGPSRSANTS
jgi:putative polyhydroxyalkanoate system protein